jgi:phosphotransacetylase
MYPDLDDSDDLTSGRIEAVVDLLELAGQLTAPTTVVPGGHRVEDLRLVESARDHSIVDRIILVGDKDRISAAVSEVGIRVPPEDIVAAGNDEEIAAATVELVKAGGVDIVLKGGISTPVINRHILPLANRATVSLATVFDAAPIAGGRPMVMTDAGVTTVCNFGRMVDLVRNAVDVARVIGIQRPRVAILSANEKQVPSLPSTWIGLQLAQRTWPDAVVCGPLSFDLATDPGSVAVKGLPDLPGAEEVAGQADVLVCPSIDAANVLYKTLSALNKYGQASLASITVGFPVPYIILSRADSLETRLVSIALCAVYARRARFLRPSGLERGPDAAPGGLGFPVHDANLVVVDLDRPAVVTALSRGKPVDRIAVSVETDSIDELIDRVAKEVGRAFVAIGCDVEAIVLTGKLAGDDRIRAAVRRRVGRLAPVTVCEDPWLRQMAASGEHADGQT